MRSLWAYLGAILCLALPVFGAPLYTIDGNLSDWGVNPSASPADWVPSSSTADYHVGIGNEYDAIGYDDSFDLKALYFDNDATNFYFGVVSAYKFGPGTYPFGLGEPGGDLCLDMDNDTSISEHGLATGMDHAVRITSFRDEPGFDWPVGEVVRPLSEYYPYASTSWEETRYHEWDGEGWQGSPWLAWTSTHLGLAEVSYAQLPNSWWVLEVAVGRSLLPTVSAGDKIWMHMTMYCGNDSINLEATVKSDVPDEPPVVPVPGAILLAGIGTCLVGWFRARRTL